MQTLRKKYQGLLLREKENVRLMTEVGVFQVALWRVRALDQLQLLIIRRSMSISQSIIWVIVLFGMVVPRVPLLNRVIPW